MAERELIWSERAEKQLYKLLVFYKNRNKSPVYSTKLYLRFNIELKKTLSNPNMGIKTKLDHVRGLIVGNYVLYYEISEKAIVVLKIWDSRQDPDKLKYK